MSKVSFNILILSFFPSRGFRLKVHKMGTKNIVSMLFYGGTWAPPDQPNPEQHSEKTR